MANKGDWGDKLIITLKSDGVRRHLKWCEYYCTGGKCDLIGKCCGSAHCEQYKSKYKEEGCFVFPEPETHEPEQQTEPSRVEETPRKTAYEEYYRRAGWGDKLLGEIVLVRKDNWFTFRIAYVVEEDLHTFAAEYDGKKHRYNKRLAYKAGSVYLFKERKKTEDIL